MWGFGRIFHIFIVTCFCFCLCCLRLLENFTEKILCHIFFINVSRHQLFYMCLCVSLFVRFWFPIINFINIQNKLKKKLNETSKIIIFKRFNKFDKPQKVLFVYCQQCLTIFFMNKMICLRSFPFSCCFLALFFVFYIFFSFLLLIFTYRT